MATGEHVVPRGSRIGRKLVTGYLPLTALGVLAVVLKVESSHAWSALLAGGIVILMWSGQVAVTNLAILALRYQRRFLARAFAIGVASVLLLPFLALVERQLEWLSIGAPDAARHLQESAAGRCRMATAPRGTRMEEYRYAVEATIRCAPDERDQACEWVFWYDRIGKRWSASLPLALACRPIS